MYIFFCLLSVETNQGICNSVTRYRKLLRSKKTLLQPEFYELTARRRFWKELCSHYIHFSFSLMAKNQNSEVGVARQQDLVLCPSNSKQEEPQLLCYKQANKTGRRILCLAVKQNNPSGRAASNSAVITWFCPAVIAVAVCRKWHLVAEPHIPRQDGAALGCWGLFVSRLGLPWNKYITFMQQKHPWAVSHSSWC